MDMEPLRPTTTTTRGTRQPAAHTDVEPKACATCRLAHASCDRAQPCGRCVRLGKTDSCQPPPTRKRGRPRKAPPPDDHHHGQPQPPDTATTAQAEAAEPASKRLCVRRKTTDPVVTPPGDSQPPHAALAPAGPHCFPISSSSTTTSPSSSSSSSSASSTSLLSPPPAAEEGWASLRPPSSPSSSSSPPLPPAGFPPGAPPAPVAGQQGHQQEQGSQEEGMRSLLLLVVDQMREMRRENKRLRDTIAQLQAAQKETERRLARVEQDQQQPRTETGSRLARVERDHHTTKRCQLAQTGIELDHTNSCTSHACPPSLSPSLVVARPALPPQWALDSESSWCLDTTSRAAEMERFIAQTLPFLRAFDQSSLIIRDLQRPFVVMRANEVETLDDVVPIIVYASPSLCKLLGYDQVEMHGCPITSFCLVDAEFVPELVHLALTPSPTPVSQPLWATSILDTKHGRSIRVSAEHQGLFTQQRRTAQWCLMLVDRILHMDLHAAPFPTPSPGAIVNELTARAVARMQLLPELLPQVPQVLLEGRRGRGRELTATTRRPSAPYHYRDSPHRQAFDEQASVVGELSARKGEAPVVLTGQHQDQTTTQPAELRADVELEELIRVLLGRSLGRVRSQHTTMVGFTSTRPPPSPSSLAERWMR